MEAYTQLMPPRVKNASACSFRGELLSQPTAEIIPPSEELQPQRKLNKVEQAREALVQWILDCMIRAGLMHD